MTDVDMTLSSRPSRKLVPWFWIGMALVFLLSVSLRFWGLSSPNILVFDEVYFAKFANNYLTHTDFFDTHPPLSKYLIAIGIWLGRHFPFGKDTVNNLTGTQLTTFSYRWLNAFTGSLIPLVVGGIAYQLSHRRSYGFTASLFVAVDGLFLVESRYALNNIYLVIFGLLGQWCLLVALENQQKRRGLWLGLSGTCFGASASVKWNGLWFLLGIYLILILAWAMRSLPFFRSIAAELFPKESSSNPELGNPKATLTPLQNLGQLNLQQIFLNLGIIPGLVYCLVWIPHLLLYPKPGFWEMQQKLLSYHQNVGNGPQEHPYCSAWYTWPLMIRPMGYYFQKVDETPSPGSPLFFPTKPSPPKIIYYDVHGMGNPVLWWLSAIAILVVLSLLVFTIRTWVTASDTTANPTIPVLQRAEFWIAVYLILNYIASLLPWVRVTRCTFIYHYMGASIFAFLALAWIVDRCLRGYDLFLRMVGVTIVFLVLISFVFWLPVFLGFPLSPEAFYSRMWFPSWI
ncbi:phospholipid carrier-dependent glycosyltransferase [Microcoleus sp. ZQ-A2]|nr:phospholipid carrier-dependent glycosyltransferase [Microcoleus sp. FACHB-1]